MTGIYLAQKLGEGGTSEVQYMYMYMYAKRMGHTGGPRGWVQEGDVPLRGKLKHKLILVLPNKPVMQHFMNLTITFLGENRTSWGGGNTPCWALCR